MFKSYNNHSAAFPQPLPYFLHLIQRALLNMTFTPETTPKADFTRPVDTSGLRGQNVLITGGASGLGAGFAIGLVEAG
jgi:NADPH:quinone reductase-like Zn-dependent oxidoreductase